MQGPITSLFFFDMVCDSIVDSGVYFRRGAKEERREEGGVLKQVSFPSSLCNTHTSQTPVPQKKNSQNDNIPNTTIVSLGLKHERLMLRGRFQTSVR